MDWIAGKMKENIGTHRDEAFLSYKDGIFTYRSNYGIDKFCDYSFDLNKVTKMNSEYSDDFYIQGRQLIYVQCDYDKAGQGNFYNNLSISGPNYNNYRTPFSFTPDQALVDRLKKAFATLVEYNSTKKEASEAF
ncbi:5'-3' exonuclease [Chryseobacterium sp. JUb7]|nr:5'-3' exonuclease [Chryseobacterium sp. JUb7]